MCSTIPRIGFRPISWEKQVSLVRKETMAENAVHEPGFPDRLSTTSFSQIIIVSLFHKIDGIMI